MCACMSRARGRARRMPRGLSVYNVLHVPGHMLELYCSKQQSVHGARREGAPDTGRWTSQLRRHFRRLTHHLWLWAQSRSLRAEGWVHLQRETSNEDQAVSPMWGDSSWTP